MSAETLAVLGSAVTILVAMFAGFGWVLSRMDRRFDAVAHEIAVRIAIARLEGPTPRLIQAR